ncbi:MAG: iron uptake porin [Cyanobacteria bacterium P01_H01_bin.15]
MLKPNWKLWLSASLVGAASLMVGQSVNAQQATSNDVMLQQLNSYSQEGSGSSSVSQVQSVTQLSDVSPGDWAYEALTNLVERYGCIEGYPNRTFRGNRATTRYEFAAGLNACLNSIERLIANSEAVLREDIAALQRLIQEFEAELAALGARVDNLEGRVAFLEDHQFSTTTKLSGEVVFAVSNAFAFRDRVDDSQVVFQDRVRLNFISSFTGKDQLNTRLDAGNATFFDEQTDQGAFTFNFDNGNNVEIGWLAYYFPIGDKVQVYLPAAFPLWQDFVPTISPLLDDFTGASKALSSFAESSPIYKIGLAAGGGIGANFFASDVFTVSAGYFADASFSPAEGDGLFNGPYSALGQITVTPTEDLQFAATYVRGYFDGEDSIFDTGVGTLNARDPFGEASTTNSFGLQAFYQISDSIGVNAFGLYTDVTSEESDEDGEIWSYGIGLAFPDLGKEGNLGGLIFGAEPYLGEKDDVALHAEGFYKYQVNDNISVTPGIVYIFAPTNGGNPAAENGSGTLLGTIRTTFTF